MEVGDLHAPAALPPGIGGWVGSVSCRDGVENRKTTYPCRHSNHVSSVVQSVAWSECVFIVLSCYFRSYYGLLGYYTMYSCKYECFGGTYCCYLN
jgi:hypothetical protein